LEVSESLLNRQLTLNFFKKQLGKTVISNIEKITFCGNDGDPIYCNDFLEIVRWIKEIKPSINIVLITNGSYKKKVWWEELANILNSYDEIHWSLDGWDQSSNEKYRVNSDWSSIIDGIKTFTKFNKTTYKILASIVFKFNEHNLEKITQLARKHSFDAVQTTLSTKFGSKYPDVYGVLDELEPSTEMIPNSHRFERKFQTLTDKKRYSDEIKNLYINKLTKLKNPKICLVGNKGVFLNSHGEFYPCCWVANRYSHNNQWIDLAQTKFNLHKNKFQKVMADDFWNNKFLDFDSFECKTKCSSNNFKNLDYFLEW